MLKTSLALIVLMLAVAHGHAAVNHEAPGPAPRTSQADEAVVPLEGLDPVLLSRGQEKQGDEQFSVKRGRFRYLFAGAETKAAFEREPSVYEIQLDGSCARMGPSVRGNTRRSRYSTATPGRSRPSPARASTCATASRSWRSISGSRNERRDKEKIL